jgi:hypothetical protein
LLGILLVLAFTAVEPNWLHEWRYLTVSKRAAVLGPGVVLMLGAAIFFWRRRKFVSIGLLLYILVDLWALVH